MAAYRYGERSLAQRATLHPHLRRILERVLEEEDHAILQGARSEAEQWAAFRAGRSRLHPPAGPHLVRADGWAYAADIVPCLHGRPIETGAEGFGPIQQAQFAWFLRGVRETGRAYFADLRESTGERWRLRFGIDWDEDGEILTDQSFQDWFHVELLREDR